MSFKADPELVWKELQKIGEQYTPYDVLEYAKDHEDSELHKCFEWNDSIAAEKWRVQQARWICNSLSVVVEQRNGTPETMRMIESDKTDQVYRPVIFTVRNPEQYLRLLNQALGELRSFEKRYKHITELQNVIEEIEKVL